MTEKFNKNATVEKFTTMPGIAVHLIVIDPLGFCIFFQVLEAYRKIQTARQKKKTPTKKERDAACSENIVKVLEGKVK